MIDIENAIRLKDVPDHVPRKSQDGKKVSYGTVFRWACKGVRNIKLETCLFGGQRYTSKDALERFFAAVTAAADGDSIPTRTPRQRQQAIRQAELELEREGI